MRRGYERLNFKMSVSLTSNLSSFLSKPVITSSVMITLTILILPLCTLLSCPAYFISYFHTIQ